MAPASTKPPPFPKGSFRGEVHLVALDKGKGHTIPELRSGRVLRAVERAYQYRTMAGDIITAPAGMVTDLASIPRLVQGLLPPDGPWLQAAIIHDLLYQTRGSCIWVGPTGRKHYCHNGLQPYTRAQADALLKEMMEVLQVPAWQRNVIYWAVRAGGASGWGH